MIHPTAEVQTDKIGQNTAIWQYAIILERASIGDNCNINCHTFIENDVTIGNNVTVKSGVYLWDGIVIKDDVFIGPNVTFTNDKYPRSKQYPDAFQKTVLEQGVSIGAAATILGGCLIGKYAMVGAGSLVTRDIPARALAVGTPAKIIAWLNTDGSKMQQKEGYFLDMDANQWIVKNNELIQL